MDGSGAQLIVSAFKIGRARSIKLARPALVKYRRLQREDFRQFANGWLGNRSILSINRMARLKAYSRSKSCWRSMASNVRRFVIADSRLAMRAVERKANRAIQFCGSAIVNAPTGGRK